MVVFVMDAGAVVRDFIVEDADVSIVCVVDPCRVHRPQSAARAFNEVVLYHGVDGIKVNSDAAAIVIDEMATCELVALQKHRSDVVIDGILTDRDADFAIPEGQVADGDEALVCIETIGAGVVTGVVLTVDDRNVARVGFDGDSVQGIGEWCLECMGSAECHDHVIVTISTIGENIAVTVSACQQIQMIATTELISGGQQVTRVFECATG